MIIIPWQLQAQRVLVRFVPLHLGLYCLTFCSITNDDFSVWMIHRWVLAVTFWDFAMIFTFSSFKNCNCWFVGLSPIILKHVFFLLKFNLQFWFLIFPLEWWGREQLPTGFITYFWANCRKRNACFHATETFTTAGEKSFARKPLARLSFSPVCVVSDTKAPIYMFATRRSRGNHSTTVASAITHSQEYLVRLPPWLGG